MKTMAQTFEEIRQRQQPVSSEVFWRQVEAFKVSEQPIQTSSDSFEAWNAGPKKEESLVAAIG